MLEMLDSAADRAHRQPIPPEYLSSIVEEILAATTVVDVHTHLYAPGFGGLGLWGIDDLLTYHYLEAELFRFASIRPVQYWTLTKTRCYWPSTKRI